MEVIKAHTAYIPWIPGRLTTNP